MNSLAPSFRATIVGWAEARLYLAIAYVVGWAIADQHKTSGSRWPLDDGLFAWDGNWYRDIARSGYGNDSLNEALRFFPLWPLLGRLFGLLGNQADIAFLVTANLFALIAAMLLYHLVFQETANAQVSAYATRIFSIFPSAFVLVFAYSEALFLALALGFVLCVRKGNFFAAIALGIFAGLTRPVGFLLMLLVLPTVWQKARRSWLGWLAVLAAPFGTATFLAWSQFAHGNWQAPLDSQNLLRGNFREPFSRVATAFADGFGGDLGLLFHASWAVAVVILAVIAARRLSIDLWLYAVPSAVLLFAVENLNSTQRYTLAIFPLVIAAAVFAYHNWLKAYLPALCAIGFVALSTLAFTGSYVP